MKKKIVSVLLALLLSATALLALAACNTKTDDPYVLNVVCLNKGYGRNWIDAVAAKFEETHAGYTVNVDATGSAKSVITRNINSKNNTDDLYICVGSDWMPYAAQGKFASLDDIMNDPVDGVALKDKIAPEYHNSVKFPDKDGTLHTYRLPWISATGGIFYNKKMFDDNGWTVPETYDELLTLCQKIVDDQVPVSDDSVENVTPFVYTKENIDYFDYTVYTWWAQLAGKDAIDNFTEYGSAANFDATQSAAYAKLKEATQMWYGIFGQNSYVISGNSNDDAQLLFVQGKAAMMFNADWMYNETLNYAVNKDKFQLALMKTPAASDAVDENILYIVGEDQYFAVPASSSKQSLAKDFIKLMVSDFGCKTFLTQAHGMLAYDCAYTADDTSDPFLQNLIDVRNSYNKYFTNFPSKMDENTYKSTAMLYLTGQIDIWGSGALRPYGNILNGQTLDEAFRTIATSVANNWNQWKSSAGIN